MSKTLESITRSVKLVEALPSVIKAVQVELVRLRYLSSDKEVDGVAGSRTTKAFEQFKKDNFLGEPDVLGPTTAQKLLKATPASLLLTADDHIRLIIAECRRQGIADKNQLAYVLATVRHETAHTYKPIDEIGGAKTRYAPYWGRGYVQLTWLANYRKYTQLTGKDLVNYPELSKDPFTAAFILVHGFRMGAFTGKKIADYIQGNRCDFYNARRCINGLDKAELIASYAHVWLRQLDDYA